MIIPWGSDAPLYHRPIATGALIVLYVLLYLFIPSDAYEYYALALGGGLHPLQWFTNIFLNPGIFALIGNVIFLWTFGFVVEGKLGWWAFILVYVGLGVAESAVLQLLVQSDKPLHILGPSSVIFGLLAMCLVWAPRNEVLCILWLRTTPMDIEIPILGFGVLYIGLNVLYAALSGVVMANITSYSSAAIIALISHDLGGVILGFLVAAALVKSRWVDCENWDLFAVLQGRHGQSKLSAGKGRFKARRDFSKLTGPPKKKGRHRSGRKKNAKEVTSIVDPSARVLQALRLHLELGEVEAALAVYNKESQKRSNWELAETDWRELMEALLEQEAWSDAVLVMRDYIQRMPEPSPRVRLKLAQVLLQKLSRPLHALKVLGEIPSGSLPEALEPTRAKLLRQAERLREDEDGPLELQDELW
jgi:membrane associated rhomboid family serine protease